MKHTTLYSTMPYCSPHLIITTCHTQVMFARVNSPMLAQRVPSVLKALQYSKWATAVAAEAVGLTTNSTPRVESECDTEAVTKCDSDASLHWQLRAGLGCPVSSQHALCVVGVQQDHSRYAHLAPQQSRAACVIVCARSGNAFVDNRGLFKLPRILTGFVRGKDCFDATYFVERNRDFFGRVAVKKVDPEVRGDREVRAEHSSSWCTSQHVSGQPCAGDNSCRTDPTVCMGLRTVCTWLACCGMPVLLPMPVSLCARCALCTIYATYVFKQAEAVVTVAAMPARYQPPTPCCVLPPVYCLLCTALQKAWKFFVYIGQFEDRPFRYTCPFNHSTVARPAF